MRIAASGAHRTGKTALIDALSAALPAYERIDEPYHLLEEEGHEFSDPPAVEDFEQQLRRSIELVEAAPARALIDRCPLDFLCYLLALDADVADFLAGVREAMERIDLIVVVTIESPDRVAVPAGEDRRFRRDVDALIREVVLDDRYGFGVATEEVSGDVDTRARQVLRSIR